MYAPKNPDHLNHESVTCAHAISLLIKEKKLSISSYAHHHHKASYVCIIPTVTVMSIRL